LEIRTKALAGLVDLQTAYASQDTALARKALIQIEEDRKANRGVLRADDCHGFDPGKDLDSQPNLDRALDITKIAKRILDQSLLELPRPTAFG
jgi:hypothetical protein